MQIIFPSDAAIASFLVFVFHFFVLVCAIFIETSRLYKPDQHISRAPTPILIQVVSSPFCLRRPCHESCQSYQQQNSTCGVDDVIGNCKETSHQSITRLATNNHRVAGSTHSLSISTLSLSERLHGNCP